MLEKFEELKLMVDKQMSETKYLWTDNGLEFYNEKFNQCCIENEITRHDEVNI